MINLILFVVIAWSIYNIVKRGSIFERLRNRIEKSYGPAAIEFIKCPICFGFWVGILVALLGFSPMMELSKWPAPLNWLIGLFFTGVFSSGSTYLLDCITMEMRIEFNKN